MGADGDSVDEWKWYDLNIMGWTTGFLSLQTRKQDQIETELDHWLQRGKNAGLSKQKQIPPNDKLGTEGGVRV